MKLQERERPVKIFTFKDSKFKITHLRKNNPNHIAQDIYGTLYLKNNLFFQTHTSNVHIHWLEKMQINN